MFSGVVVRFIDQEPSIDLIKLHFVYILSNRHDFVGILPVLLENPWPAVQAFSSGARMFCSRKRHAETQKRGENRLPSTYRRGYYFYSP